ncbi:MAG: hypothetical protein QNJ73_03850 [Gammaproteobacteria bacterium]|nr:hypothetical protein [Gammaproteobacteria bacterium]
MRRLGKLLAWTGGFALVFVAGAYGTFRYMNRTPPQLQEPNYYVYYQEQDTVPVGRVGLFISHLVMPEEMEATDFYNMALKSLQYIPWPIRNVVRADRGIVLLDTDRYYEFEEFKPTKLVDPYGSAADIDGLPYIEKWRRGEIAWVPPNPSRHLDHGYFLLEGRGGGMPSVAAKLINKARTYYYTPGKASVQGKVPHEHGMRIIVEAAMDKIRARYGDIPYRWITAENFGRARAAMFSLLDEGIDTVVLSAPAAVYSHHEEFNGAFKHAMHYIHEWEEANDKHVKVIMTRQLGDFEATREPWVNMLRDRLDQLPAGVDVKVAMSMHGMPWDRVPHEAWIELSPGYIRGTMTALQDLLDSYQFGRTEIVETQDHFADHINDPENRYLSTNQAFWEGVEAGYDYVINVPIEFFAENTDTLYYHAMANFEGFEEYDVYDTIDYADWDVPYTRQIEHEGTIIIYNGVPVGNYNEPLIRAYVEAIDQVLSQRRGSLVTADTP